MLPLSAGDIGDIWALLDKGGVLALFVIVLMTGSRGVWVWKERLLAEKERTEQERKEKEYYRDLALKGTAIAEHAVVVAANGAVTKPTRDNLSDQELLDMARARGLVR